MGFILSLELLAYPPKMWRWTDLFNRLEDDMKRVYSIICVVFLLAPTPLRMSAAQGNQFDGWPYSMAICAATVLDKETQLNQLTSTQSLVEVRVTETFWGKQDLKALYVLKGDPLIRPGERILLAVRSDGNRTLAVADTAENRNELRKAIEARARIRVERGFLDVPALLDEGEDLLRSYVRAIAERLPNDPHLGKLPFRKYRFIGAKHRWAHTSASWKITVGQADTSRCVLCPAKTASCSGLPQQSRISLLVIPLSLAKALFLVGQETEKLVGTDVRIFVKNHSNCPQRPGHWVCGRLPSTLIPGVTAN